MSQNPEDVQTSQVMRIMESARRLGVEFNEEEALQWLTAMSATRKKDEIVVDARTGIFGDRIALLDFSPADLEHFREVGRLVEFEDRPGEVETALALSGSAAQSKIQTYPGDCDYFERVNIIAPTREQAGRIMGKIMREKAMSTLKGPTYQLIEVKFGSYPCDVVRKERTLKAKAFIAWKPDEILAGQIEAQRPDGAPCVVRWDDVAVEPGWCKLDWVVWDPVRSQLANASNMLDVTWQAPDGTLTPLDGYLDPYFQEVYLDAHSIPVFTKLAQHVSANALDDYVAQLQNEVRKYLTHDPANYGKVAKRMYNIFRLTGRYEEAVFLRELFDEPATILYQVWSLIQTIEDAFTPGASIPLEDLLAQCDQLIVDVVKALEGVEEAEIVRQLLRLRNVLSKQQVGQALDAPAEAARDQVINIVNNFFYEKLSALPTIKAYMEEMQQRA